MGASQTSLKAGHFNEYLVQKTTHSLAEVVTRAKCYVKDEESKAKKKSQDVKEHDPCVEALHNQSKSNYTSPIKDKIGFKRVGKTIKSFKPLNTRCKQIWCKFHRQHKIPTPPTLKQTSGASFIKLKGTIMKSVTNSIRRLNDDP